ADVRDLRSSAVALRIIGKIGLPIGVLGRRPVSRQLGGAETCARTDVEAGLASQPHVADATGADKTEIELAGRFGSGRKILFFVTDFGPQIEPIQVGRQPSRRLE